MRIIGWDVGTRDLAYCVLEVTPNTSQSSSSPERLAPQLSVLEWKVLDISAPKLSESVEKLCGILWDETQSPLIQHKPEYVFIEYQFDNSRMVAIGSCLQCCAYASYIMNPQDNRPEPTVQFIVSRTRMDLITQTYSIQAVQHAAKTESAHRRRAQLKSEAIRIVDELLQKTGNEKALADLRNSKTKQRDDMADSLLLCLTGGLRALGYTLKPKKTTRKPRVLKVTS